MDTNEEGKESDQQRVQRRAVLALGREEGGGVLGARGGQSFTEGAAMGWITCCSSVKKCRSLLTVIRAVLYSDGVGVRDKSLLSWQEARMLMAIKTKKTFYSSSLKEKIELPAWQEKIPRAGDNPCNCRKGVLTVAGPPTGLPPSPGRQDSCDTPAH